MMGQKIQVHGCGMLPFLKKNKGETFMETEYICDDRPIPISEEISKMTDEEIEKEFQERFGMFATGNQAQRLEN